MTLNETHIRELLRKENLFGRWAEHPEHGRGIIVSPHPTKSKKIKFAYKDEEDTSDTCWDWIPLGSLTLDPVELTTKEDYQNAPEGTIVAQDEGKPFVLIYELWRNPNPWKGDHSDMAGIRRRVLRWGMG